MPLVFHSDKFGALAEIAAHPVLSKRMKSLYYADDLLKGQDWHDWYIRQSPAMHYRNAVMEFNSEIELRSRVHRLRLQRALGLMDLPEPRTITDVAAPGRFNELYADQATIVRQRLDVSCFRAMFEGCPNLREATVAFRWDDGAPQRRLKAARTAFAGAMTVAHGPDCALGLGRHQPGRHHLMALAQALRDSGRSLDSLTVVNVYYEALYDLHVMPKRLGTLLHSESLSSPCNACECSCTCQIGDMRGKVIQKNRKHQSSQKRQNYAR
ncbi:hypothetical protein MBLNU13_g08466t2 [Cladosporium sp. NU13]